MYPFVYMLCGLIIELASHLQNSIVFWYMLCGLIIELASHLQNSVVFCVAMRQLYEKVCVVVTTGQHCYKMCPIRGRGI